MSLPFSPLDPAVSFLFILFLLSFQLQSFILSSAIYSADTPSYYCRSFFLHHLLLSQHLLPPPSHTPYTMTTEQNIAYQHFHTALESLAEYKPRYQHQQKNDHPSHMYLSNKLSSHTIPSASAFGDEHLPYSPYYSFGISNNSCASSFTSISSSTSIASSDDFDPLPELRAFGKKAMKREKSSSKKMTCTMDPSLENPNDMIAYSENIESKR